jgi:Domain of unknown function (DUF4390)
VLKTRFFELVVFAALLAMALLWAPRLMAQTSAERIEATSVALEMPVGSDSVLLTADFILNLNPRLEDAVNRGLSLYWVLELEMYRPRWYWFDRKDLQAQRVYRLSYHALTRQYRVSMDGFLQSFVTLPDALASIRRIRGWRVGDKERLQVGDTYDVSVRLRLDTAQLPKPFQLNAITNRDWNPQSEWKTFRYTP